MSKNARILATVAIVASTIQLVPVQAAIVDGATYYYTIDGTDPTTSGTRQLWADTSAPITLTAPDTDAAQDIVVKAYGEKDGVKSDIVSTTVHYGAKEIVTVVAPILDPATAQTFVNRDTDNYFDIRNTDDTGVSYYYTTDGTEPTAENGTLISGKSFKLDGPDQDTKAVYNIKVIGLKGDVYSEVTSVRVTYEAKVVTPGVPVEPGETNGVKDVTIKMSKSEALNRDENVIAFISGKTKGAEYYATLDGTTPTKETGIPVTGSYIRIPMQDVDEETQVIVTVKGFSEDGTKESSEISDLVTFGAKKENTFIVVFKDRTYKDIAVMEYTDGEVLLDYAPEAPEVPGYTFLGWSTEKLTVTSDMIVRALYERDAVEQTPTVKSAVYNVINNGTDGDSYVQVGNGVPGATYTAYLSATEDTPAFSAVANATGECTIVIPVGNLTDEEGQVYMDFTSMTKAATPRLQVKYQSRAVAQAYSLPILASRLQMANKSTLMVRGIESGEVVKVYDMDNNLLGTAKQGRAAVLEIGLSEDVVAKDVYVSRIQVDRLESQQTELNKAVIQEQLAGTVTTNQTVANVKILIETALGQYKFSNTTTQADLEALVNATIINSNITGVLSGFNNTNATDVANGSVVGTVTISDSGTNDTAVVNIDYVIAKTGVVEEPTQTVGEAENIIKTNVGSLVVDNSTTKQDIIDAVTNGVTNATVVVDVKDFVIVAATEDSAGSITGTITIEGGTEIVIDKTIAKLEPTVKPPVVEPDVDEPAVDEPEKTDDVYLNAVASSIQRYLNGYTARNTSDQLAIEFELGDIVDSTTNAGVTVKLEEWNKVDSTDTSTGLLTFLVKVINDIGDKVELKFNKVIAKTTSNVVPDGGTPDNGTETPDNGTGTPDGGTGTPDGGTPDGGTGGVVVDRVELDKAIVAVNKYLKGFDASNSSKKSTVSKKIEGLISRYNVTYHIDSWDLEESTRKEKGYLSFNVTLKDKNGTTEVINYDETIAKTSSSNSSNNDSSDDTEATTGTGGNTNGSTSTIEGNSTATGTETEVNDTNGNQVGTIVKVVKGGKVIIEGYNGLGKLYKLEPVTGKYIVMSSGISITNSVITLQADANTTYYIANKELDSNLVLSQGWNVVNGNVYRIEGAKLATGWVKDGDNWYYVDNHSYTRVDNTWRAVGSNWYYLGDNGIMATGWLQNGGQWYYLNNGGDMATGWKEVDGNWYYLGTNGNMQTGWVQDRGTWYFLNTQGVMSTGWKQVGDTWYYLNPNSGAMVTGWHKVEGSWYYLNTDGSMAYNTTINGYKLDSTGKWY